MSDFLHYIYEHRSLLSEKVFEHVSLTLASLVLAFSIAIPLGIWIRNIPYFGNSVLKAGSISQTIPSLALLAFLVPLLGLGTTPTIFVLTFYALYPLLLATNTGLKNVPPECLEAADGLGFSTFNKLRYVEFPLALPFIISGLRIATAMTIGIATIAALIGAGGLGDFIVQGLALNDSSLILLGAIPTALLALSFDFGISHLEKRMRNRESKKSKVQKVLFIFLMASLLVAVTKDYILKPKPDLIIGSKNFTEQNILAEIIAQQIEKKTNLKVERLFNLGATAILHQAMVKGEIDLYPEYSGSAYVTILKKTVSENQPDLEILETLKSSYKKDFNFLWLDPFGFTNSQSLAVKRDFARLHHLLTMSDLAKVSPQLNLAVPPDYLMRPDGLPGLQDKYHLKFKKIMQVEPSLMYAAIDNNQVEVIAAFTTDGKLLKHDLVVLKDDKKLYPPYFASLVIRMPVVERHPEIITALTPLIGSLTNDKMMKLNAQVEVEGKTPAEVARQFLNEINYLP